LADVGNEVKRIQQQQASGNQNSNENLLLVVSQFTDAG